MKLADLSPETITKIKTYRWDRIIEKHEGPETWTSVLKYHDPEFRQINGYDVLLPIERGQHPNITVLRVIPSADGQSLTIFLKDTTWYDDPLWSGFVAVCDKVPGEDFYLTVLYHEWMIIENRGDKPLEW
ncbi:MAG: hypothetical protein L0332_29215 [Chloroflexi bacterium]|nr:hypothetical protein [Chloroflexota bacterium]MCI0649419.1 hypothetical protein [Chloroflexota bacterium]MCI0730781.1 hypothetical protein [Chloroflexota bacterium]